MRFRFLQLLIGLLCALPAIESSIPARADVRLYTWQATPSSPRLILPQVDSEGAETALRRYLQAFAENSDLQRLIPPSGLPPVSGRFSPLGAQSSRVKAALISNMVADLYPSGGRILRNVQRFSDAGADVYVIPPAADLGLSLSEADEFREQVARGFDLLVSMGGYDVHHRLTGNAAPAPSRMQISWVIDTAEYKFVETFKRMGVGVFFASCRGHQLGALVDGHELYSDLSEIPGVDVREHVNPTGASTADMLVWHEVTIVDPLLLRLFRGLELQRIQSAHHQAVRVVAEAASVEAAVDRGVNEALVSRNGLGISLQFHIDFPESISRDAVYSQRGLTVIRRIVSYARLVRLNRSRTNPSLCEFALSSAR